MNEAREVFKRLDLDRTGKVPVALMAARLQELGADGSVVGPALDADGDGFISWPEFCAFLPKAMATYAGRVDDKKAELVSAKAALAKHRQGEFSGSATSKGASLLDTFEHNPASVKAIFDKLDKDHDGKVSAEELGKGLGAVGIDILTLTDEATGDTDALFKAIDFNGDGSIT